MKSVIVREFGDSSKLVVEDLSEPELSLENDAVVQLRVAGVNMIDVYQREGRYPGVTVPLHVGIEGAGVVSAATSASRWRVGDRVAFIGVQGSYAEAIAAPSEKLVRLPDTISFDDAATILEQGVTAHFLLRDAFSVAPGHTVLIHAAAGGVGMNLVQQALHLGAKVIATVSAEWKKERVQALGADVVLTYNAGGWADEVRRATNGQGVDVVYNSVGKETFDASLSVLKTRGHLVLFGAASGPVPPVDPVRLMAGSYTLLRPRVAHYIATPADLDLRAAEVFSMVSSGKIKTNIHARFQLNEAHLAHDTLSSRQTYGKIILDIRNT